MTDESNSFSAAKTRLEEIVTQVRKKDTSLEKSLDLLEEGVRLANVCTELIDHADWVTTPGESTTQDVPSDRVEPTDDSAAAAASATDEGAPSDDTSVSPSEDISGIDAEEAPVADHETAQAVGEVWSEDEAWAEEVVHDPSDGDDGHGA